MFNYVTTAILVIVAVIWLIRFLNQSGLPMPDNKFFNWITAQKDTEGEKVGKKQLVRVFFWALGIRIIIYLFGALSSIIFSEDGVAYTFNSFMDSWIRWDASNYIDLATKGYNNCIVDGKHLFLVFFPLYPMAIRMMSYLIRDYQLAALVVSVLSFCAGSCYFYALIAEEYGKSIAKKAFIYLSIFPFSFFFGGVMTESLFFFTTAAAFYYIKHHNWTMVTFFGILASLTRLHGVLLIGVAGIELFTYYKPFMMIREKRIKELFKLIFTKGISIAMILIGPLIYLYINYKVEGNPFQFMIYQKEHWGHENTYFANTVKDIFKSAINFSQRGNMLASIWIPEALIFILAAVLIIYSVRRHNLMYSAYLLVYTIINYSVTWLISGGRYMLCALPIFIILGEIGENRKEADKWITVISAVGLGVYMTGYLMYRNIM